MDINKLYCIDNVEGMNQLPDNFIDLTVTSPPYDNMRKYKGFLLILHRWQISYLEQQELEECLYGM